MVYLTSFLILTKQKQLPRMPSHEIQLKPTFNIKYSLISYISLSPLSHLYSFYMVISSKRSLLSPGCINHNRTIVLIAYLPIYAQPQQTFAIPWLAACLLCAKLCETLQYRWVQGRFKLYPKYSMFICKFSTYQGGPSFKPHIDLFEFMISNNHALASCFNSLMM